VKRVGYLWLALVAAFLYLPLARVVATSFNDNQLATSWGGFTTRWYEAALSSDLVRNATWNSVKLACVSAIGATALGTLSALALRRVGVAVSTARVATPEVVIASGFSIAVAVFGWRFGIVPMAVGHIAVLAPFVTLLVAARAAGADPALPEVAADLGAPPWKVFLTVTLPDLAPAIGAGVVLSAAFSFDNLVASRLLAGSDSTTLPMVLLSMIQRRVTPEIDAIGTMVLGVGLFALALVAVLGRVLDRRPS
jgi:putrescine transport system permease protein